MKLTKYRHACLFLESEDAKKLVIDPGCFTVLPDDLTNVVCLIITEEHVDHFNLENIKKIVSANPEIKIFTTPTVNESLAKESIAATAITDTFNEKVSDFTVKLKQVDHAPVYENSPCKSLTVQIDNYLYYPSDSYTTTDEKVEVLALPTSGPWHKVSEAIDFANHIKSKKILTTHNGLHNDDGHKVANNFIKSNLGDQARQWIHLEDGHSI